MAKVTMKTQMVDSNPNMSGEMPPGSVHWKCILQYKGRHLTVHFSQGPAICPEPEPDDVLECLFSDFWSVDCAMDFWEWAQDMGYDMEDGKRAEKVYKAIEKQSRGLRRLLGDDFYAMNARMQETNR